MKTIYSIRNTAKKLFEILNKRQKIYGFILLLASLVGALLEVIGVGIILPLVQAFVEPQKLRDNVFIGSITRFFYIEKDTELIIMLTIGVIIIFIIKNVYFIFLVWFRKKYSCMISRELSSCMIRNYMRRGYEFFLTKNTSELSRNINADVSGVDTIIYQAMRVLIDSLTLIFIVLFIMITDWMMALSILILAVICLGIIYGYFRVKMKKAGILYNQYNGLTGKYLLEALHGIKEIIAMNKEEYFISNFESANLKKQQAAVKQAVGTESPAYVIEAICVAGLLGSVCMRMVLYSGNAVEMIPTLSAFVVAAFRILPSLGRISSALNTAIYYIPSLDHVYENMNGIEENQQEISNSKIKQDIRFENELKLENICWHYENSNKDIIHHLDLSIRKGSSVAVIGSSGAGKTTLADILLGLLKPQTGKMYIDGKEFDQKGICSSDLMGYVPQSVYLTDDTIRSNVAFGVEMNQIKDELVWEALEKANLKEFVLKLPKQLDTLVGDRGIRFSGGQRQRIAIARAMYRNPEILIFDEATASLDNETENAVMESIQSLQGQKTLVIIAHRLTTIRNCDTIFEIKNGCAIPRKYEELQK